MHIRMITIACSMAASAAVSQTLNEWVGPNTGSWFEPTNWSEGRIPNASDRVVINREGADVCVEINGGDAVAFSIEIGPQDQANAPVFGDEIRLNDGTLTTTGENLLLGTIRSGSGSALGANELIGGTWTGAGGIVWAGNAAPGANQGLTMRDLTWAVDEINVATGRRLILEACTLDAGATIRGVLPDSLIEIDRRLSGDGTLVVGSRLQGFENDQEAIFKGPNIEARAGANLLYLAIDDGSVLSVVPDPNAAPLNPIEPVMLEGLVMAPDSTIDIATDQTLHLSVPIDLRIRGTLRLAPGASIIGLGGFSILPSTSSAGRLELPASGATPPIRVDGDSFLLFPSVVSVQGTVGIDDRIPVVEALGGIKAATALIEVDAPAGVGPRWDVTATTADIVLRCLADTNFDGQLTPADFNAWIILFNQDDLNADQNLDGLVTPADFNAWIINFNNGC